jgi:Holliday junction resolvase RusA-like endonuclease
MPMHHPPLRFQVIGKPAPQGSKRGFLNARTGRVQMVESSARVKPWRQDVSAAAIEAAAAAGLPAVIDWAVAVEIVFLMRRPRGHLGRRGLRPSAPEHPSGRPDVDKLARATLDGLTILRDDSLVVDLRARKVWAGEQEQEGALVLIMRA